MLASKFPDYTGYEPRVPVRCVTPGLPGCIHRFYDSSPFSPSGRYMALARLPFEDRLPGPGDAAGVVIVDLETGEAETVADTRGWDTQLGAQVQWGGDDRTLLFNDVDTGSWTPFGVRMDPLSGERHRLDGTIYAVAPDGRWSAGPCLRRMLRSQRGYGVVVPDDRVPSNHGASGSDGIYLTDLSTGETRLLVSIAEIFEQAFPARDRSKYAGGDFYGFHVKWNPQGTRLLFVLRWIPRTWLPWKRKKKHRRLNVITLGADGSNPRIAVADTIWRQGGNHPNWCPDGEHILMNLNSEGDGLRFARIRYDGTGLETLSRAFRGSGHPTMHRDQGHILTDAYPHEPVAFGDGTVPIRWLDLGTGEETTLARIRTRSDHEDRQVALRVDPHPAWDRDFRRIAFNACPEGRRHVFVAQMEGPLAGLAAS